MDTDDQDIRVTAVNGYDWHVALPKNIHEADLPLRDISFQAVWTVSSCKSEGNGVHELLHDSVEKYWQSDGPQPHTVTIEFPKKTDICFVMMYLDFKNDESYTPSKIIVYMGSSLVHLDDGVPVEFNEPTGWQVIDLRSRRTNRPSRAMMIQLQVVHNHQNGRDTHIRHIRVLGPNKSRFALQSRLHGVGPGSVDDFILPPVSDLNKLINSCMSIR
ncbi:Anaphase-promoting complex, subunit 10 [Dictyocaulus viviparus]|uniref:Anaphase-promoting complex subunit 10 n=1 Tax=Dictyocaulus viviparus TaxID=29172 RepID=A0A0D8XTA4_DICVI|nr:Anaphase-promoting complex, subunit 10 [Dictyocaulus viviparus]